MKFGRFAALVLGSLALVHCATTPDEPAVEPLELPVVASADQAAEIAEARRRAALAIASAEDAGAETYAPLELRDARDALQEGDRLRTSDPEAAADAFDRSRLKADEARWNTLGSARKQLESTMKDRLQELKDEQADKSRPEEYSAHVAEVDRVNNELFAEGMLAEGNEAARAVIWKMEILRDSILAQVARVLRLKADTEALRDQLAAAAQADASKVAEMDERYAQGRDAMEVHALGEAERHFGAAKEAGQAALAAVGADTGSDMVREQVETLLRTVMNDLESASSLMVITDDERGVDPEPWQGARYLSGEGTASAAALPARGEPAAVEDVPQHELLKRAKELWLQGVARRNAGDYRQALAYLEQAQRHHAAFVELAVMTTYTVRLIPERRESLWRIAEYDHIYGNPRLWPRIFHRNRKLIQHPDLIFPGWQLYIPPAQVPGEAPLAAQ